MISKISIFFDFDRTLFNTDKLYSDMMMICIGLGHDYAKIQNLITTYEKTNARFNYFNAIYSLGEECSNTLKKFLSLNGTQYVFDDVIDELKILHNMYSLKLITYGDNEFQTSKILASSLGQYFDDVIVTEVKKQSHQTFQNTKFFIFIDDNPREIEGVKSQFPDSIVIRIKRNETKYAKNISNGENCSVSTLKNLSQILDAFSI